MDPKGFFFFFFSSRVFALIPLKSFRHLIWYTKYGIGRVRSEIPNNYSIVFALYSDPWLLSTSFRFLHSSYPIAAH